MLTLNKAKVGQKYKIAKIIEAEQLWSHVHQRMRELGFFENKEVFLTRKSGIWGNSYFVDIEGTQFALSEEEASFVEVVECQN